MKLNEFKTSNNPDENPDLPMDFKNLGGKPKVWVFSNNYDCQKENLRLWERNPLSKIFLSG
jgi:hypothetical protein